MTYHITHPHNYSILGTTFPIGLLKLALKQLNLSPLPKGTYSWVEVIWSDVGEGHRPRVGVGEGHVGEIHLQHH